MSKHTPGPWVIGGSKLIGGVIKGGPLQHFTNGSGQSQIAMACGADWMQHGELEANARLIAAAPDLLEALESIEMRLDAFNEADRDMPADSVWVCLEKARAAIAKARGEA